MAHKGADPQVHKTLHGLQGEGARVDARDDEECRAPVLP
jgi:hypothetical protein